MPGPESPSLEHRAVHVWRAELAAQGDELTALLCAEERARVERFPIERDGQLWARSCGVLRALLGAYLDANPCELRFTHTAHGKPVLFGESRWLRFNLSHSGGLALYAIAADVEVGVDVQLPRSAERTLDVAAIAERAFGALQARRLQELEPRERERELLRLWTRYEAELKCSGRGIGGVDAGSGGAGAAERSLWIAELDVGSRAAAALACEARPSEIRLWEWPVQA
jgi:4'-phosphopantetheinyl transferase